MGRIWHVLMFVTFVPLAAVCAWLYQAVDHSGTSTTEWLAVAGALVLVITALYYVGARSLSTTAANTIDRRYGLTLDDTVVLIGDVVDRQPLITRICALPTVLMVPALTAGFAVNDIEARSPQYWGLAAVAVSGVYPVIWAYYGWVTRALLSTAGWFVAAVPMLFGWPIVTGAIAVPLAIVGYLYVRRLHTDIMEAIRRA